MRNDEGQWLLLSAIVAAVGLGVVMILLNTAALNGHSSIISIGNFPKNDIRDLRSIAVQEAIIISGEINDNSSILSQGEAFTILCFNDRYDRFVSETNNLYHAHGAMTDIIYMPNLANVTLPNGMSAKRIINVSLNIHYYNSDTIYTENVTVGI